MDLSIPYKNMYCCAHTLLYTVPVTGKRYSLHFIPTLPPRSRTMNYTSSTWHDSFPKVAQVTNWHLTLWISCVKISEANIFPRMWWIVMNNYLEFITARIFKVYSIIYVFCSGHFLLLFYNIHDNIHTLHWYIIYMLNRWFLMISDVDSLDVDDTNNKDTPICTSNLFHTFEYTNLLNMYKFFKSVK